jgi:hypothetical protein
MTIHYAREQASKIVHQLGASAMPLRDRLVRAYTYSFIHALGDADREDYLPEELHQSMMLFRSRMTARESVQATLERMMDREMVECADEMIDIALRILRVDTRRPEADVPNPE